MKYKIINIKTNSVNEVNLTDRHYITEGGEGKIFGKDKTIYKIYNDAKKMIPSSKMNELQQLDKTNILKPIDKVRSRDIDVGFTMLWIKDTFPLCKLFTNDFWKRFNITPKIIINLIEKMVEDIKYIHGKNCLIVDGNEFNYLVSNNFKTPYFIDVDSYQTPHFPATAIMPSIRDYNAKTFTELSDWYSFAIVATQLLIGIHPFRGKHANYKRSDMEKRMRDNVSIFNKGVSLPAAARDFDIIPKEYKHWFIELFEKGERTLPPKIGQFIPFAIKVKIIKSTNMFTIELYREFEEDILHYSNDVVFTNSKAHIGKAKYDCDPGTELIYSAKTLTPIKVSIKDSLLKLETLKQEKLQNQISCSDKTIINDMLFILNNDKLLEILVEEYSNFIPVVKSQWNVLPNSTKLFNGIAYQDVLGIPYFILPYKKSNGKTACMISSIKELKGYRVLEMKQDNGVVFVVAFKNGKYDRFIFKINSEYDKYECQIKEDVSFHVPNFVTLENGIVVSINSEDQVEVFHKGIGKPNMKVIKDDAINFDMKLCKRGVQVFIIKSKKLYKFKMNS